MGSMEHCIGLRMVGRWFRHIGGRLRRVVMDALTLSERRCLQSLASQFSISFPQRFVLLHLENLQTLLLMASFQDLENRAITWLCGYGGYHWRETTSGLVLVPSIKCKSAYYLLPLSAALPMDE